MPTAAGDTLPAQQKQPALRQYWIRLFLYGLHDDFTGRSAASACRDQLAPIGNTGVAWSRQIEQPRNYPEFLSSKGLWVGFSAQWSAMNAPVCTSFTTVRLEGDQAGGIDPR
jgi:hypothetical protein